MSHPLHPKTLYHDMQAEPLQAVFAVMYLLPVYALLAYGLANPERALRRGVELAGGPEPFAWGLALGLIGYAFVFIIIDTTLEARTACRAADQ